MKILTLKCIVAGETINGPDLFFIKVRCTEEAYNDGFHYEVAKNKARDYGYDGPLIAFDENDSAGKAMLSIFDWDTASTLYYTHGLEKL